MSDGSPRDPWNLSRLGREDFVSAPLDPVSDGFEEDDGIDLPGGVTPPVAPGRRLRPEEREELRRRARDQRRLPPEYFGQSAPVRKRRWPRWGGVALILLVIIVAGNIRFFGSRGSGGDLTPTADMGQTPPSVAIAASPTASPPTPTAVPTSTPEPSPTPTPIPTPDPRFAGTVVCLDPGHGGRDRGFERGGDEHAPAMEEAVLNLEIALAVRDWLEQAGFTVVLTRTEDRDVNDAGADVNGDGKTMHNQSNRDDAESAEAIDELQARINVCNDARAELLISMHFNGHPDSSASGYETWYSSARPFIWQNRLIAALIHDELGKAFARGGYNVHARGVRDDATANVDAGRHVFDRYVITGPAQPGQVVASAMPGTIVEALFLSNGGDAAILANEVGRQAIVEAYAQAIIAYFNIMLGPAPDSR